jgi:hypothetical protein
VITLLGQTNSGATPTVADLQSWANTFGLTHPVVADPNWSVTGRFVSGTFGLPSMHLIGPGAEVLETQSWIVESDIEAALPPP